MKVVRTGAGLLVVTIGLVFMAISCTARLDPGGDDAVASATVDVQTQQVQWRTFVPTIEAPGEWKPVTEVPVVAPFAAVVESLGPRAGDHVTGGQVVGQMVTRESRDAIRGAELLAQHAQDPVARREAARALDLAHRDLVRVPLLAPATGLVVRRSAEVGAEVSAGTELLALVPADAMVFEGHVPLADADAVRVGQHARIVLRGDPPVEARVQRLLPNTSVSDQTALVWLAPVGATPAGVLGRFCTALIATGTERRVVSVPDSALVEDDLTGELRVARVDTGGIAIWTPVRVGTAFEGWHELLAPALPEGTPLVIAGQRGLPDSARVRIAS